MLEERPRRQTAPSSRREAKNYSERPRSSRLFGSAWHLLSVLVLLIGGFLVLHGMSQPDSSRWVRTTKPIEEFWVCNKVAGENPLEADDLEFGEDVDPKTWRFLQLLAPKDDGTYSEIDMVRPLWWLEQREVVVGETVYISVPECGIDGNAQVLNIGPYPPVDEGPGRVVTAVYRHHVKSTIGVVLSDGEQINCTANHLWYSAERDEFVRTDQLRQREKLASISGDDLRVESLLARPGPKTVYNLEVQVAHVYHVGESGALVHNGTPCPTKVTGTHSRRLADDLIAKGYPRPPGYQAGHIVPTNVFTKRSAAVRKAITTAQTKFNRFLGEDLRDAAINGFWAKAGHAGTHTDKFFLELGKAFRSVNSRKSAEAALESLWKRIDAGEFL